MPSDEPGMVWVCTARVKGGSASAREAHAQEGCDMT